MLQLLNSSGSRLFGRQGSQIILSNRGVVRIPHWEYHIRFDPKYGRKRPCQDVLDRFKRLNNGMWIRGKIGTHHKQYQRDENDQKINRQWETCTKDECAMLDAMMTPFWLRFKHYVDDHIEPYQIRYGLAAPRVNDKKKMVRERSKILLDDLTADLFFDRLPPEKTKAALLISQQKSNLPKLLKQANNKFSLLEDK